MTGDVPLRRSGVQGSSDASVPLLRVNRRPRSLLYKKTPKRNMSKLSRLFKRRSPVDPHLLFVHFVNFDEKTGSAREMPF